MINGLKSVPIDELRVGMYVEDLPQSSSLSVRAAGLVSSEQVLAQLRASGVKSLLVDPSRSKMEQDTDADIQAPQPSINKAALNFEQEPETSIEREIHKAKQLFGQAKGFAKLALDKAQRGEAIDLADAEQLSEAMIRSVFRNSSALLCMTRLRTKDQYLLEHSVGVATLIAVFARSLKLPAKVIHQMTVGALLHDIGKIYTPDEILHKPGKLTAEEFVIMKQHAVDSYRILKRSAGIPPLALEMAANHHERPDGNGYPRGIGGEKLSRYARMIGIVDCYDALTADRVYRKGMEPTRALRILLSGTPHQFDSELVAAFIRCIGVYPIGTLVELESNRVAVVVDEGKTGLTPKVKLVYHATHQHHLPHEIISLDQARDKIKSAILPEKYDLDFQRLI